MTFYNQKVALVDLRNTGLSIYRLNNGQIERDYLKIGLRKFNNYVEAQDVNREFDIALDNLDKVHLVYLDREQNLILDDGKDKKILKKINTPIYELNTLIVRDSIHVFYQQRSEKENILDIKHLIYEEGNVIENLVDQVKNFIIINPFKVINDNDNLILTYYYENQICMKVFDNRTKDWSPSFTLTDNKNKLYIDMMKVENNIHLVYAYFENELFSIQYESFYIKYGQVIKDKKMAISGKGNNTDPILLLYDSKIWVVWKESNKLLSSFSYDGDRWDDIYSWEDTKRLDMVKYKYLNNYGYENIIIDNSYGSIYPEIKFIGFSGLEKATKLREEFDNF